MCSTTRSPGPSGSRMSVRQRSNASESSNAMASPTVSARVVSRPIRDSVSSSNSSRSGSSSTRRTLGWPRDFLDMFLPLVYDGMECAFHRQAKVCPGSPGQEFQRGAVRVGELAGNVQAEAGASRTRREKRLEDLGPQLRGNARAVVRQLADYRITHVARARGDANAAFL